MHKRCNRCGEVKPRGEFHNMKSASDGKQGKCKCCVAEYQRNNRDKCRDKQRNYRARHGDALKLRNRGKTLENKYGITLEQFDVRLASQGGCCAICRTTEPGKNGWHVDHDHSCCPDVYTCGGCVRGILCARCNICIGMFNDDADLILKAVAYITDTRRRPSTNGQNPQ